MKRKCVLIGVEGNHDQAFLVKILRNFLDFKECKRINDENLDGLWRKFIPNYPSKTGNLHQRLDMPSVLYTDTLSVAVYAGEGSNLPANLKDKLSDIDYLDSLAAFAVVADSDKRPPSQVAKKYHDELKELFSDFPYETRAAGFVTQTVPRLGIYILPNNLDQGVLDTLICECGDVAYTEYMQKARSYIDQFSDSEIQQLRWKPFDRQKAIIATVVSILKPGMTNTASIAKDNWINSQTITQVSSLKNVLDFLNNLLSV
ncbi:MAG: hypothetical protein MH825_05790 [Cyanobacteria bacterium]|nr:hypothetical protein [Cyanobacteriota bacterium]